MRLFRISRTERRDPLKAENDKRQTLNDETANLYADLLETIFRDNSVADLYLSQFSILNGGSARYQRGQKIELTDLRSLIVETLEDRIYCMIRDWTCRFVFFTYDPVIYICLKHEDEFPKWQHLDVVIQDVSEDLIKTDIFDK